MCGGVLKNQTKVLLAVVWMHLYNGVKVKRTLNIVTLKSESASFIMALSTRQVTVSTFSVHTAQRQLYLTKTSYQI